MEIVRLNGPFFNVSGTSDDPIEEDGEALIRVLNQIFKEHGLPEHKVNGYVGGHIASQSYLNDYKQTEYIAPISKLHNTLFSNNQSFIVTEYAVKYEDFVKYMKTH